MVSHFIELLLVRFPENQKSDFQKISNWISRESEMKTMGALIFCASLLLVVVSKIWFNANVNLNKSSSWSWWQKTQFQSFFQLVDETSGVPLCWGNIRHLCLPPVDPEGPYGSETYFREWQLREASRRRLRERYGFRNYWLRQIFAYIQYKGRYPEKKAVVLSAVFSQDTVPKPMHIGDFNLNCNLNDDPTVLCCIGVIDANFFYRVQM